MKHHEQDSREDRSGTLLRAAMGAIAGAIGVWALDRVTWALYNREDEEALAREKRARPEGLDPAHKAVVEGARAMGVDVEPKQPTAAGVALHYSLGIIPGALYAVYRRRVPLLTAGRGTLFGTSLFLLQDELLNAVTGLSGKPQEYPWQAHARGLVGHVAYGIAMESALDVIERRVH